MECCSGPRLGRTLVLDPGAEVAANGEGALISPASVGGLRFRLGL